MAAATSKIHISLSEVGTAYAADVASVVFFSVVIVVAAAYINVFRMSSKINRLSLHLSTQVVLYSPFLHALTISCNRPAKFVAKIRTFPFAVQYVDFFFAFFIEIFFFNFLF